MAEQGFPGFDIENWQGVFAPAGTPAPVVELLARHIGEIAADKVFAEQLQAQGASPAFLAPKEFGAFVAAERRKYSKLVKESGAKAD
jgi:tripartite-type tricarboxylate transporter receptor subunit TctC